MVTINADFNKKASKDFEIKAVPHVIYFKNGEKLASFTGKRSKEEVEEFIRTGMDKKQAEIEKFFKEKITSTQSKPDNISSLDERNLILIAIPIVKNSPSDKLGMVIREEGGRFVVAHILPNSIAEKSGLKQNDIIVRMNMMDLKGVPIKDFINRLQEEQGIILYIKRRVEE